jgi:hypothetical protein
LAASLAGAMQRREEPVMGQLMSVAVAAVVGVGLAIATAIGLVNVSHESSTTARPAQPLVVYGQR